MQTTEDRLNIAKTVQEILTKSKSLGEKMKKTAETVTEVKETVTEVKEAVNTPEVKPEVITETPPAPEVKTPAKPEISLFADLGKKTEEDLTRKPESKIEKISESLQGKDDLADIDVMDDTDPKVRRQLAEIKASGIVEVTDMVFMFICMAISGNWDKKAQEAYTMTDKRKEVLKILIVKIQLTNKQKKINPVGSIILVAVTSAVPMVVMAIWTRVSKKRAQETEAQQISELDAKIAEFRAIEARIQLMQQNGKTITTFNSNEEVKKRDEVKKDFTDKNIQFLISGRSAKSKGRHGKDCLYHKDKNYCNCGKYA